MHLIKCMAVAEQDFAERKATGQSSQMPFAFPSSTHLNASKKLRAAYRRSENEGKKRSIDLKTKGQSLPGLKWTWAKTRSTRRIPDAVQKGISGSYERYLAQSGLASAGLTFVYGDTHDGGWEVIEDRDIRVYNCGCWVTHDAKNHPLCYIFAVEEDGSEVFLDVSFHGVTVEGDPILNLAASESEHNIRKGIFGRIRDRLGI